MRGMWKVIATTGLLTMALLPLLAAVPPEAAPAPRDAQLPVAIAQPLAAMDTAPLVLMRGIISRPAMLPESGMLVLVGSALIALAAVVRRNT